MVNNVNITDNITDRKATEYQEKEDGSYHSGKNFLELG